MLVSLCGTCKMCDILRKLFPLHLPSLSEHPYYMDCVSKTINKIIKISNGLFLIGLMNQCWPFPGAGQAGGAFRAFASGFLHPSIAAAAAAAAHHHHHPLPHPGSPPSANGLRLDSRASPPPPMGPFPSPVEWRLAAKA